MQRKIGYIYTSEEAFTRALEIKSEINNYKIKRR